MTQENIIQAWRDAEYRASLTAAERAQLPEHPAGLVELSDADLDAVSGGPDPQPRSTSPYCLIHPTYAYWRTL
jgi:mersacidin/lichenicidin family type 2 lantibiotic